MQVKELIRRKRDGEELSAAELESLVSGYVRGEVADYQMAALLMAIYFRGLSPGETSALTRCMWKSGEALPRKTREDFWIDKHSTGGVGDKTSLLLVPLVSAVTERVLGKGRVRIPMVSGRGLGHSGGTLDKLEAVPGFSPALALRRALELLDENGFFMMGQTPELVPADRLLYALRDVTSTVESIPLIVSSIMSKKLAESLDGLVFDVKTGTGAFMAGEAEARELSRGLLAVAKAQGVDAVALLTRMDEPLGFNVGNLLEVEECRDFIVGKSREKGLQEVAVRLAGWMVHLSSRRAVSLADAEGECMKELQRPENCLRLFRRMFEAQGGDFDALETNGKSLRQALCVYTYPAPRGGVVAKTEARALGILLNALGGGRNAKEEKVDPWVGIELRKKVGDRVERGEPLLAIYYRKQGHYPLIETALSQAIAVQDSPVATPSWIVGCEE